MIEFCGQEQVTVDGSGRIKLPPSLLEDFQRHGDGTVVLHCQMPEGCVGIYPPDTWRRIRQQEEEALSKAADSVVMRRRLRRFGALSQGGKISNQGRITIPPLFRDFARLEAAETARLVGCESGVELWNEDRWQAELGRIEQHVLEKAENEMSADLMEGPEA